VDPVKITIFLAAFGLLFLIGRALSSSSEVHAAMRPSQRGDTLGPVEADAEEQTQPALVGSEIEFPIQIPPMKQRLDGTFNRPIFTNYYFAKIDLLRGPADPDCFVDEFTLQTQDPGTEERITYQYTVATPAGLRQYLEEERFDSLYIEARTVIIARWDLGLILRTVIDQIMQESAHEEGAGDKDSQSF
jgi:hypothetical protein